MAITEIFPKPTVKKVIFQIRFPNLFFIEARIGELQMAIMDKFPESALLFRRQIVFADIGPSAKLEELQEKVPQEQGRKVWQFKSTLGYQLNVLTDSLDITSNFHKTYNNPKSENRFCDIIEHVLKPFFTITKLPIIGRVGLRYIDECPFHEKTTKSFLLHFDSCFSTNRFSIEDSTEHQYKAVVKRGDHFIRYIETLNISSNPPMLVLDFDGFALDVPTAECMETTNSLHELISKEYESTIKEPIYKYMRGE
jgi:uncharacterized protein (TIGR04255 family)